MALQRCLFVAFGTSRHHAMKKPILFLLFASIGLACGADSDVQDALNDARKRFPPGDYDNFIPRIKSRALNPPAVWRPDLLDALPPPARPSLEERARQEIHLFRGLDQVRGTRLFARPLSLSLEVPRSTAIPESPTEDSFKRPIRLFDVR
jgi:hypothetical protein